MLKLAIWMTLAVGTPSFQFGDNSLHKPPSLTVRIEIENSSSQNADKAENLVPKWIDSDLTLPVNQFC
jgi:hypothetical protein